MPGVRAEKRSRKRPSNPPVYRVNGRRNLVILSQRGEASRRDSPEDFRISGAKTMFTDDSDQL